MKVTETPAGTAADRADRLGEQPWARTSDRNVWRACKSGLVLTVTHLVTGGWQADIEGPGVTRRSPVLGSRGAAQAWADDRARGVS
jgi:hypothetical protein